MKRTVTAFGKAFLYFLVYMAVQLAVSIGAMSMVMAQFAKEAMAQGEQIDQAVLSAKAMEEMMQWTTLTLVISGVLALLIYWIICVLRNKKLGNEVCLRAINRKGVLPIFLLGASFNVAITFFLQVLPFPQSWIDSYMENASVLSSGNIVLTWISTVLMAPVLEEIVFRGFVYTRLKRGMPILVAAILSSLLFGAMHGTTIWFAYTFVFGMLLTWCFEKYKSLMANILLHMAFNVTGQLFSVVPEIPDVVFWILSAGSMIVTVAMIILICRQSDEQKGKAEDTGV